MKINTDLITWNSKLACGIKLIDEQHKGLVDLVNEMFNHITSDAIQEKNYFKRVVEEVAQYVKIHFATEEKIMRTTKFSGYAIHKKEHETFIRTIVSKVQDYEAEKRFTISAFTRFLRDWILSHIALMDKQYFLHLREIASRKADGKLSITIDDVNNI